MKNEMKSWMLSQTWDLTELHEENKALHNI